jgi:hypothetical protein
VAEVFWIPVVGPLLARRADSSTVPSWPIAVMWSLAEATGLTLTVMGFATTGSKSGQAGQNQASLSLVPVVTHEAGGLMLRARF